MANQQSLRQVTARSRCQLPLMSSGSTDSTDASATSSGTYGSGASRTSGTNTSDSGTTNQLPTSKRTREIRA